MRPFGKLNHFHLTRRHVCLILISLVPLASCRGQPELPLFLAPVYFISFATTAESFPSWAPEYAPEWFGVLYGIGWILLGILLP